MKIKISWEILNLIWNCLSYNKCSWLRDSFQWLISSHLKELIMKICNSEESRKSWSQWLSLKDLLWAQAKFLNILMPTLTKAKINKPLEWTNWKKSESMAVLWPHWAGSPKSQEDFTTHLIVDHWFQWNGKKLFLDGLKEEMNQKNGKKIFMLRKFSEECLLIFTEWPKDLIQSLCSLLLKPH